MIEPTRYALDARADNYGWKTLTESPGTIPVSAGETQGEDAFAIAVPIRQSAPDVLNRVNAWLSRHSRDEQLVRLVLEPRGVLGEDAILEVRDGLGSPASARAALQQIAAGLGDVDARTRQLVDVFLNGGDRVSAVSPIEVLESVKSSFALEAPLSVKSSFANTSRRAVKFVVAPALPTASSPTSRVVVASPDTGIGTHPWLADGTWTDAQSDLDWEPGGTVLPDPGDRDASPMDGEPDFFAGHGTFVAGLVRQLAPAAHILSLRSMAGDGTQPDARVLNGLEWIRDRVATGSAETFVDVVCLACGYYTPTPGDDEHTRLLASVLWELGDLGVQVVVAAGNDGTGSPTFPAAFAGFAVEGARPRTPLVAVGALNPDGSRTDFSNFGDWVATWEPGVALISTVPTSFGHPLQSFETEPFRPSNLVGGFAEWSGTSFSAAVLAGKLADALARTKNTIPDVHDRTRAARESLGIQT